MATLKLAQVKKNLGGAPILRGIDLDVADGALVVLVGPSGCGKSTLLRTIAGLETCDAGSITIDGKDVTHADPRDRDVAMVFQSYALYPHLTVRDNIAFGMKLRRERTPIITKRIDEVAERLGIKELLDRLPKDLSGGQRQRVAMGRAIARRPKLFLFDEPLSNLDAALRNDVRLEIKRLQIELGTTMIYVTHDQTEAMTLADQLVVLRSGTVEQVGAALEVYDRPTSRFVAGFLGSPKINFIRADVEGGRASRPGFSVPAPGGLRGSFVVGLRPHDLVPSVTHGRVELDVEILEHLGSDTFAHGHVAGESFVARIDAGLASTLRKGSKLRVGPISPSVVRFFDETSERAVNE